MNKKILPENIQISEYNNLKKQKSFLDNMEIFKSNKRDIRFLTAITLPLILAACGGGGGGGAVSPTPDAGSGGSSSGGSSSGGSSSGGSSSGGSTSGTQANAGYYTATSEADNYVYDVTFSGSAVTAGVDGNVIITDFDAANDTITLRGSGAPESFTSGGSSNVDVASTIDGDTVITLGNDNDNTGSITLKGVSDSSTVVINTEDGAADDGAPKVDLSSGAVTASDAGEVFEYSVNFLNGTPVATDGDVVIDGFDAKTDKLIIKTDSLPSGYGKGSLLNTSGVDVTAGISETRIDFGVNASGASSSITLKGIEDSDLSSIDLVFEIIAPTVVGSQVDIDSASIEASSDAETFVYDASWDGDEVIGADGNVTISGFSLASDKILVIGSGIPAGYDRSQFEGNSSGSQQIVVDEINNQTVIYFAADADGTSTTLTLSGVADTDGTLNIVFGSAVGELVEAPAASSSDTSSTDTASTDDTTTTDDTASTDDTSSTTTSYTVVNITETAEATITASDSAEDFRYEIDSAGVSQEGAFTVTIDGFDTANDKLTLVIVGGSDNLTTQEFDALSGVEVTSDGLSGTQIFFAPDSSGQSGGLTLSGVEESFDDTWTATTYTVEILADTNLT